MSKYTIRDIQTILTLSGLVENSASSLPQDVSSQFDLYFCYSEKLHFLKDTINYLLEKRDKARNRRVAFVIDTSRALIVEYRDLDPYCLTRLLAEVRSHELTTVDQVMAVEKLLPVVQQLYGSLRVQFIGILPHDNLSTQVEHLIRVSYPNASISLSSLLELPPEFKSVIMTEAIIRQLKWGVVAPIDIVKTEASHKELCSNELVRWFFRLQEGEFVLYEELMEIIQILMKYTLLQEQQSVLERSVLNARGSNALGDVLRIHLQLKRRIFSAFSDPIPFFPRLPLSLITQLLTLRKNPERMLETLTEQRDTQYQAILTWEQDKERRLDFKRWRKVQQAAASLYSNSLLALGGEMLSWLARSVNPYIPWESPYIAGTRDVLATSIKFGVFFVTLSPALANRAAKAINLLLTREQLPILAKLIGIDIGAIMSLSVGAISLCRMMLLPVLITPCRHYLKFESINLRRARSQSYEEYLPSLSTLLRLTHLLIALFSSYLQQDFRIILHALSGTAGSIGLTRLGDYVSDEFREEIPLSQETRDHLRFVLSISGLELGYNFAKTCDDVMQKIAAREAALTHINETIHPPHRVERVDSAYSPMFWFTSKNRISISWTGKQSVYETECQITVDDTSLGIASMVCEAPHAVSALLEGPRL